jgi:glycolate oxidase FAD binding subunit
VAARATALTAELASFGAIEEARGADSERLWRALRDATPFAALADRAVWRVSVPPVAGPMLVAEIARRLDARHFFDWGGGLVWLAIAGGDDGGAAAIRAAIGASGGHATLIRGAPALRNAVPVFEPQPPALVALTRRVKESFDPKRVLNRGRMYAEL